MTEEEKEAIEELESATNIFNYVTTFEKDYLIESIKVVVNLTQKQQVEINKLKNQNKLASEEHEKRFNEFEVELEKKNKIINELEDKINSIETYYDISNLEQMIKDDK